MKVAITGAAGWVGRAVLENFTERHQVRAFDYNSGISQLDVLFRSSAPASRPFRARPDSPPVGARS